MSKIARFSAALLLAALLAGAAAAADNALLIQLQQDGGYRVWHGEGATVLAEEALLELEASARPEGGRIMHTLHGPAQAFETKDGVLIDLPGAGADNKLLLDRDLCGGLKAWHAAGVMRLAEDELTELVLTALPDGGKRIKVGGSHARGYTTRIGVIAVIWKPVDRPPAGARR